MRECERYWIVLQERNWEKLKGILLFWDRSWLLQCMQRSFSGKITPRICAPSEIQLRSQLYRNCSTWLKNWSANKNWGYRECRLCIVRWKDARIHQNPKQNRNVKFRGPRRQISTENWMAGHMTLQVLHEIQKLMATLICSEKEFQGRIILVSMVNDIEWRNKYNNKVCLVSSPIVSMCAKRFATGHSSFFGLGSEGNGTIHSRWNLEDNGTK